MNSNLKPYQPTEDYDPARIRAVLLRIPRQFRTGEFVAAWAGSPYEFERLSPASRLKLRKRLLWLLAQLATLKLVRRAGKGPRGEQKWIRSGLKDD